jgi:GTPase
MKMNFKSGFVSIIGRPNVGKSTLLNKLTGEKIAIISNKPQTTRNKIRAVITDENYQIVFLDTPGIHLPKTKLGDYMVTAAKTSMDEADTILFLIDAEDKMPGAGEKAIAEDLKSSGANVFLVINKIDKIKKDAILEVINNYKDLADFKEIIPVSAYNGDGTDYLLDEIKKLLPQGPQYFSDEDWTDQPEKTIVAELIREKLLRFLDDEIPHGIGVEILNFKEREGKDIIDIQASIYCDKESHKSIIIGKNGAMIKKVGSLAREEAEKILGSKIFLETHVKVKPGWKNSSSMLKQLGYE